jgi:hypothetical protein
MIIGVVSLLEYYTPNHSNTFSMGKCQEVSLSLSLEIHQEYIKEGAYPIYV